MADNPGRSDAPQVQINASDEVARGRYSNNMLVSHTPGDGQSGAHEARPVRTG